MDNLWAWFWWSMICVSVVWYGFLVFWLGIKGGREILDMTRTLSKAQKK